MPKAVNWVLCLILSCCVYKANAAFTIQGVHGKVLENVELRLKELTQLKPLNEFTKDQLLFQIDNALKPFGYFKAHIEIKDEVIYIQTGPQLLISSINLEFIGEGQANPLLRNLVLPLKVGEPLVTEHYNQAKLLLINTAENLGFLRAEFKKAEIIIDENNNTADIQLIFNTNALYYFGPVQFTSTTLNAKLLQRYVPFKPGQVYSSEKVLQLNKALSDSGYFNSVVVKPQMSGSSLTPIEVQTEPVPHHSYFLGAGFGTDTGPRGRAGLHVIPVNQWGHQFTIQGLGSLTQNSAQARYLIPGANPSYDQYSITGNVSSLLYDTGYSNASQLSLAHSHQTDKVGRNFSLNALYEGFHYSDLSDTDQFLIYPKATFEFKHIQNPLFSPSGYHLSFNAQGSSSHVLSQLSMAQFWVDAKAAYWFDPLGLRLYGHAIQGYTNIKDINQLPLSLALLLGGTDNLKAYSFNSIGPGKTVSYAGVELQKETFKNWFLVGFYDAGAVYNPTPKQLQQDAGAGLMWVSPIGPIKVGLAQGLDNNFQRSGGLRLFISMGPDL